MPEEENEEERYAKSARTYIYKLVESDSSGEIQGSQQAQTTILSWTMSSIML